MLQKLNVKTMNAPSKKPHSGNYLKVIRFCLHPSQLQILNDKQHYPCAFTSFAYSIHVYKTVT